MTVNGFVEFLQSYVYFNIFCESGSSHALRGLSSPFLRKYSTDFFGELGLFQTSIAIAVLSWLDCSSTAARH